MQRVYMDDSMRAALEALVGPEISKCMFAIQEIAGYELNIVDRQPFLYFHEYLTNPEPAFISEWRADQRFEKWYHRFVNGMLNDVKNTLACVLYHHERLRGIESSVISVVERLQNCTPPLLGSTMSFGNTLVWDFEYQAFILAFRRCLDYLARAICTYFRNDFHSFRRLASFLDKSAPAIIGRSLSPLITKYYEKFDFVLSEGTRKSVRDKISHYEYVPAGTVNLGPHGFMFVGGGEELGISGNFSDTCLTTTLSRHVDDLRECIREVTIAFVDAMRADQLSSGGTGGGTGTGGTGTSTNRPMR
jgi:hypothetical protein